eukprot:698176-Hanusia_phi.AAC.1
MASSPTNVDKAHKKSKKSLGLVFKFYRRSRSRTHAHTQSKEKPGKPRRGRKHRTGYTEQPAAAVSSDRALRTVPGDESPEIKAFRSAQTRRTLR